MPPDLIIDQSEELTESIAITVADGELSLMGITDEDGQPTRYRLIGLPVGRAGELCARIMAAVGAGEGIGR